MKMKRKKIKTSRQARKVDDVENDDENEENYLFTYASARPDLPTIPDSNPISLHYSIFC
jgi:hypothetical protein